MFSKKSAGILIGSRIESEDQFGEYCHFNTMTSAIFFCFSMCSISFLLLFLFSFTASYCIKRFFFQCNILIPLIIFSLCFLSYFFSGSSSTEHIHLNLESTSDLCCLNFNVVWKCGSYISYFLLPFCTVAVIIVLLLLYILHLHVLQTQQYSVIIITPHNCMSVEESENKGRQAYVYRFFLY